MAGLSRRERTVGSVRLFRIDARSEAQDKASEAGTRGKKKTKLYGDFRKLNAHPQ